MTFRKNSVSVSGSARNMLYDELMPQMTVTVTVSERLKMPMNVLKKAIEENL
jgi:hypothetical protein